MSASNLFEREVSTDPLRVYPPRVSHMHIRSPKKPRFVSVIPQSKGLHELTKLRNQSKPGKRGIHPAFPHQSFGLYPGTCAQLYKLYPCVAMDR
jgi:hypothetical protein